MCWMLCHVGTVITVAVPNMLATSKPPVVSNKIRETSIRWGKDFSSLSNRFPNLHRQISLRSLKFLHFPQKCNSLSAFSQCLKNLEHPYPRIISPQPLKHSLEASEWLSLTGRTNIAHKLAVFPEHAPLRRHNRIACTGAKNIRII